MLFLKYIVPLCLILSLGHSFASNSEDLIDINEEKKFLISKKDSFIKNQKDMINKEEGLDFIGVGLFRGKDPFSDLICLGSASRWSHVGAIVKGTTSQKEYVYETTGAPSEIAEGILPEARITLLDDVVKNYSGNVAKREFVFSDKKPDSKTGKDYVLKNIGKPYEKDLSALVKALRDSNTGCDVKSTFCSEEVILLMEYLDIRKKDNESEENFLPRNFGDLLSQPPFVGTYGGSFSSSIDILKQVEDEDTYISCPCPCIIL